MCRGEQSVERRLNDGSVVSLPRLVGALAISSHLPELPWRLAVFLSEGRCEVGGIRKAGFEGDLSH